MKNLKNLFTALLFIAFTFVIVSITGIDAPTALGVSVVANGLAFVSSFYATGESFAFVSICGSLTKSILKSCAVPIQGGTRDRMAVINFDDLSAITYVGTTSVVDSFVIDSLAIQIDGKNNSIMPNYKMVKVGFEKMFDHIVGCKGFDISQEVKDDLNKGKDGRYVVITENFAKGTNGTTAFEIYGISTGLEMTELDRDPNSADTQGAFNIVFGTDKNKEPLMPNYLFIDDYATTKAFFDALFV